MGYDLVRAARDTSEDAGHWIAQLKKRREKARARLKRATTDDARATAEACISRVNAALDLAATVNPNGILDPYDVDVYEWAVLQYLLDRAPDKGAHVAFPKLSKIAAASKVGETKARDALRSLEAKGYIKIVGTTPGGVRRYAMVDVATGWRQRVAASGLLAALNLTAADEPAEDEPAEDEAENPTPPSSDPTPPDGDEPITDLERARAARAALYAA